MVLVNWIKKFKASPRCVVVNWPAAYLGGMRMNKLCQVACGLPVSELPVPV